MNYLDFNEIDSYNTQENKKPRTKKISLADKLDKKTRKPNASSVKISENTLYSRKTFLLNAAKTNLKHYITKTPEYIVLIDQIKELTRLLNEYKLAGNNNLYNKTVSLIKNLNLKKKNYINLYTKENRNYEEINKKIKIVENTEEVKNFKAERNTLKLFKRFNTASSLTIFVKELRDNKPNFNIDTVELDFNIDLVDLTPETLKSILVINRTEYTSDEKYYYIYSYIINLLDNPDINLSNIHDIKINTLKKLLTNKLNNSEEIKKIDEKIQDLTNLINLATNKATGNSKIEELIFDLFEFNDDDLSEQDKLDMEFKSKDILITAYIEKVQNYAINKCYQYQVMNLADDIVGICLLKLCKTADTWFKQQKNTPNPVPFSALLMSNLSNMLLREIMTLKNIGVVSGSVNATDKNTMKKRLDAFRGNNPEARGMSDEALLQLLYTDDLTTSVSINAESDINGSATNSDGSISNLFDNLISEHDNNKASLTFDFRAIVDGFNTIMNLKKEIKTPTGNIKFEPYFDDIDIIIINQIFGFKTDTHLEAKDKTQKKTPYTQDNIADYLNKLIKEKKIYIRGGSITKSAVSTRISNIFAKLKEIGEKNPNIKKTLLFYSADLYGNFETIKQQNNIDMADYIKINNTNVDDTIYDFDDDFMEETNQQINKQNINFDVSVLFGDK